MATYPFYLGPLGAMRLLPSTKASDEIGYNVSRSGGIRSALGGRSTQDIWGSKQIWDFEWKEEQPEVLDFIQRLWKQTTRRPLRLLDAMGSRNLLSVQAASVGAEPDRKPLRAFDVQSRTIIWTPILDTPEDLFLVEGGLQWSVPINTDDMLRADLGVRVPIMGNPVTFSFWARGEGSVHAVLEPYGATGTTGVPLYGPQTALNVSEWERVSVTIPDGSQDVSAVPALAAVSNAAGVLVETVGWQAEYGTVPTPWMRGGACPQVLLVENEGAFIRGNRRNLSLSCREV